jgi:hypothetical protein
MVPSWIKEVPRRVKIDKAHKNLPNLRRNTYFISALFPFEIGNNDEFELGLENSDVHYSATSQRILGKRYFDVYSGSIFSSSL